MVIWDAGIERRRGSFHLGTIGRDRGSPKPASAPPGSGGIGSEKDGAEAPITSSSLSG